MDWEARYQSKDTPWDKGGAAHPALLRFLLEGVPPAAWVGGPAQESEWSNTVRAAFRARVMVPGCGFGADVRAIAGAAVDASGEDREFAPVVGIDLAPTAVREAAKLPKSRPTSTEVYDVADLFNLPEQYRAVFDGVWEHTCFCAIKPGDRPRYVEGVVAALKPGGFLLAVFYLNPDMDPGEEGPPFKVSTQELDTFFDRDFEKLAEWEPETFPQREGRERVRLYRRRN